MNKIRLTVILTILICTALVKILIRKVIYSLLLQPRFSVGWTLNLSNYFVQVVQTQIATGPRILNIKTCSNFIFHSVYVEAGRGENARLLGDLLKDYDPDTKPLKNLSRALTVKITLTYNQLQDLVSTSESVTWHSSVNEAKLKEDCGNFVVVTLFPAQ
jgi:hypothetical protein